jgi:hypothetical protein
LTAPRARSSADIVGLIDNRDIAVVLNDLAETRAAAAGQARGYLSAVFVWATGEGLVENNPVAGTNNPGGTREARDRVLTNDELIQIWNDAHIAGDWHGTSSKQIERRASTERLFGSGPRGFANWSKRHSEINQSLSF